LRRGEHRFDNPRIRKARASVETRANALTNDQTEETA
jgi:hypothetical protein